MKRSTLYKKYFRNHSEKRIFDSHLILWLMSYLKPYKFLTFLAIISLIGAKLIEAFIPLFIGYVTQQIVSLGTESSLLFHTIVQNCIWVVLLLILAYLLDTASMLLKNWVGQNALYTLRTDVYEHIQHLPLSYFDYHPVGRLMTRTIHDIDQISQMMTESIVPLFGSVILFAGMCIGLTVLDWRAAVVFAIVLPFVAWSTHYFRVNQRYCYDIVRGIVSVMNSYVQEHLMGAAVIRNFGLQEKERKQFDEINEDYRKANLDTIHYFSLFIASIDLFQGLSLIMIFIVLLFTSPIGSTFQVGTFFAFTLYVIMFFRPLTDLAERYNVLQSAMSAAERVLAILKQKTEKIEINFEQPGEVSSIEFKDVWFAYSGENWVLKGISFKIQKGESFALVGVTGSGKSSIINLLLRMYEFQKGSIKINGIDIREYPIHSIRREFSTVLQDPVIFSGTIYDNIVLFQKDFPEHKIKEVVEHANLTTFVERFPEGVFHNLTERGQTLSAGEMQLISLARAVAHERSVLILDEATSNIDSVTEKLIQDALNKILKLRTAIVIAHRLSTIKDVTKILVLHNGVITESGTHKELLEKKGIYEKIYRIQFQDI